MDFRPDWTDNRAFRSDLKAFRYIPGLSDFKVLRDFTLDFKVSKPDFRDFGQISRIAGISGILGRIS